MPSAPRAGASRWQCGLKYCHCHRAEGKPWVLGVWDTHILVSLCSRESPHDVLGASGVSFGVFLVLLCQQVGTRREVSGLLRGGNWNLGDA